MPQMSPINWTLMYMYIFTMFFLIFLKIFYYFNPENYQTSSKKAIFKTYIKWMW